MKPEEMIIEDADKDENIQKKDWGRETFLMTEKSSKNELQNKEDKLVD
jgi:hypothetical protein|tara:strand:- start:2167 stop:2310 length:144 start_codon:yes stop_codon:yes gene_type:complete